MKYLLLLFLIGCSNDGKPCIDWRVQPGKDSLVAAYVQKTLSSIVVAQRNDNEDWDDFEQQAFQDAVKLYGYWATGTYFGEYQCYCEQDGRVK